MLLPAVRRWLAITVMGFLLVTMALLVTFSPSVAQAAGWSGWTPVPGNVSNSSAVSCVNGKCYSCQSSSGNCTVACNNGQCTCNGGACSEVTPSGPIPTGTSASNSTSQSTAISGQLTTFAPATTQYQGEDYVFATSALDSGVYYNLSSDGKSWRPTWAEVGTPAPANGPPLNTFLISSSTPAAIEFQGQLYVFAWDSGSGYIFYSIFNGSSWNLAPIPGNNSYWLQQYNPLERLNSAPAAISVQGQGLLYVFVRSMNDRIWYSTYDGSNIQGWTEWPGGMQTPDAPAVVQSGNSLLVFVRGTDRQIYYNTFGQ